MSTRFIIQVDVPRGGEVLRLELKDVEEILAGTGVILDPSYRPVAVNPALGRWVVRGHATPKARSKAEAIPGVRFFADASQEPA